MLSEFILFIPFANARVTKICVYYLNNGKNVCITGTGYFFEGTVCSQSIVHLSYDSVSIYV